MTLLQPQRETFSRLGICSELRSYHSGETSIAMNIRVVMLKTLYIYRKVIHVHNLVVHS